MNETFKSFCEKRKIEENNFAKPIIGRPPKPEGSHNIQILKVLSTSCATGEYWRAYRKGHYLAGGITKEILYERLAVLT